MARGRSIIVGGGLGAVGALAVGAFVSIATTDPASVQISPFLGEVASGVIVAAGRVDPQGAATEVLRIKGGIIVEGLNHTNSVAIGRAATITGTYSAKPPVVIGTLAALTSTTAGANADGGVVIGYNARAIASATTANAVVVIGPSASALSTVIAGSTVIGANATDTWGGNTVIGVSAAAGGGGPNTCIDGTVTGGSNSVCIRATNSQSSTVCIGGIAAQAASQVVIGSSASGSAINATCLGASAVVAIGHSSSIVIGSGTSYATRVAMIVGANGAHITTLHVGGPDTSTTAADVLFRITNGSGANDAAGNFIVQPGVSTGNAVAGNFVVRTGDMVTGSSSTLQTVTDKLIISGSDTDETFTLLAPGTRNVRINWSVGGTVHAVVGVAGVANGIITGSTAGDLCIRSVNQDILFSPNDGANSPFVVTAAGDVVPNLDRGFSPANQTDAAAAAAGTLGNAPAAGNPAFWWKVKINGVNHAIPCWLG